MTINNKNKSRRLALRQMASMGVLGVVNTLRAPRVLAGKQDGAAMKPGPTIKGNVIHRQDEDYELWRHSMVWHTNKPKRYPDMIAQATSEAEVIEVVKYAAATKQKIAIKSGGHSAVCNSIRDGGILLDLAALSDIEIDESKQMAHVQPAARGVQLLEAARKKDLCFNVAHCPTVGIGGFVMGGGIGWNYGPRGGVATFSIEGADIVTADGRLHRAGSAENEELLWAVRGGGPGFFGVVTRFHLKLYPFPKSIFASTYIMALDDLATVTETMDKLLAVRDDRLECLVVFTHNPEAPADTPPDKAKVALVGLFAFGDSSEEARAMLKPYAQSPLAEKALVKDEYHNFSFEELYANFFSTRDPAGAMARYAADSVFTDEAAKTLHLLADHFRKAPSPSTHILTTYGVNLKPREDACFSGLGDHLVGCFSIWEDEKDDEQNYQWLVDAMPMIDTYARGHYINEIESRYKPERYRLCFTEENWARLRELRKKYDPNGVFHNYLGLG